MHFPEMVNKQDCFSEQEDTMSHSIVLAHEEIGFAQRVQAALQAEEYTVDVYVTGRLALDAVSALAV
jgi:hypothetical protein